ncbi:MAG: carboxypeptidase M32 [Anaerolineae bacterium]|nr:carboxypeptidase M32 [Anaerolineae bacterium]NIN95280.1 carboxypeptidase M32 [Anaerolineae bacterium]NIQ78245.1 carboxypeptidase M32 [Anaerolineae bacterium]
MGEKLEQLRQQLGVVADLSAATGVLSWDQQTYMPPGGAAGRAMQLATLSRLAHERFVSDDIGEALAATESEVADLDPNSDEARLVKKTRRDYDKARKVPAEWVGEFRRITALAHQAWEKARAEADFPQFQPHLEKVLELRRQYVDFFAPYDHIYDPLLDDFEPGMKTAEVKAVFDELRPQQVELVRAISERGAPVDDSVVRQTFAEEKQRDFGLEVVKAIGYDFERGRQDKSVHPFTSGFGTGDVRITTRFDPKFLNTALFGSMHEAGHAMYEQGVNPDFDRTPLADAASLAMHESQSRLWENLVGRSRPFWVAFYARLQEVFPSQLGDVSLDTFYRAINKVQPSFIRVEADEATYNLHIMLRFELEISLMDGTLGIGDLPEAWNARFEEFLGLTPSDDAEGVLQDIHWSGGMIGYFPTYALGNLVASQLWAKIAGDIPDLQHRIERGEFGELLSWLREHVHKHGGKFEPVELLTAVTGSGLTAEPYLRYLRDKFGEIYKL